MAVILPFEKEIYQQAQIPVDFVGHPLVEKMTQLANQEECRKKLNLPHNKKIIALLPGSRTNEIERHMPVLRDTAQLLKQSEPDLHFIIPIAASIKTEKIEQYFHNTQLSLVFIKENAIPCMIAADFVIVASGTASLECALLQKPMCIIYKSSLLTYIAAMKLIKVKFLGLCNLLANKMIVPEFLQYDCNPIELAHYIINFYQDASQKQHMLYQLAALKKNMSLQSSDKTLKELVEMKLNELST